MGKPNGGSFSANRNKKEPQHADFNGTHVDENGKEWWINVWKKDGANGEFYSYSLKPKLPKP